MTELHPPGPELAHRNRVLIAERLRWPVGARRGCENVEAEHPGWNAWWQRAGWAGPEGWYALHDNHWHLEPAMYGATPDELAKAIRGHRCHRWPDLRELP